MLDDLYWVMSYSRWKDERYWHSFRDALLREHSSLTEEGLAQGAGIQCPALSLPRHRPLRSRCRDGARARRPRSACRSHPLAGLFAWRETHQRRCRHLWFHRQHLFLRHRYTAQAIRNALTIISCGTATPFMTSSAGQRDAQPIRNVLTISEH